MFEEDIFGEDSVTLVLRYGDYVIQNFDKKSKVVTFNRLKQSWMARKCHVFSLGKTTEGISFQYLCQAKAVMARSISM